MNFATNSAVVVASLNNLPLNVKVHYNDKSKTDAYRNYNYKDA